MEIYISKKHFSVVGFQYTVMLISLKTLQFDRKETHPGAKRP